MEVLMKTHLLFTCSLTVAPRETTGMAPQGVANLSSYAAYQGLVLFAPLCALMMLQLAIFSCFIDSYFLIL